MYIITEPQIFKDIFSRDIISNLDKHYYSERNEQINYYVKTDEKIYINTDLFQYSKSNKNIYTKKIKYLDDLKKIFVIQKNNIFNNNNNYLYEIINISWNTNYFNIYYTNNNKIDNIFFNTEYIYNNDYDSNTTNYFNTPDYTILNNITYTIDKNNEIINLCFIFSKRSNTSIIEK